MEYQGYLTIDEFGDFLASNGYPLEPKNLKFSRDKIDFEDGSSEIGPELDFVRVKGIRKKVIPLKEAEAYLDYLQQVSFKVDFEDVKTVTAKYAPVMARSRKHGMRGNRNFTGKIEDEIKGKLGQKRCRRFH